MLGSRWFTLKLIMYQTNRKYLAVLQVLLYLLGFHYFLHLISGLKFTVYHFRFTVERPR